jgi:hypothetical protein
LYNNNYFSEKAEFRGKRRKKAEKEGTLKNSPSEKRKNSAGAIKNGHKDRVLCKDKVLH